MSADYYVCVNLVVRNNQSYYSDMVIYIECSGNFQRAGYLCYVTNWLLSATKVLISIMSITCKIVW